MICTPCREASDAGYEGLVAHADAGCKQALDLFELHGEPTAKEWQEIRTLCDCQHRDDLPKRELKASEA